MSRLDFRWCQNSCFVIFVVTPTYSYMYSLVKLMICIQSMYCTSIRHNQFYPQYSSKESTTKLIFPRKFNNRFDVRYPIYYYLLEPHPPDLQKPNHLYKARAHSPLPHIEADPSFTELDETQPSVVTEPIRRQSSHRHASGFHDDRDRPASALTVLYSEGLRACFSF